MALKIKTFTDFFNLIIGKFKSVLPDVDPTIEPSIAGALAKSSAIAGYGLQDGLTDAVNQSFWQTSDGEFLNLHGGINNVTRNLATKSSGFAAVNYTLGLTIPAMTELNSGDNNYSTIVDSISINYSSSIALTFSTGIVTVVTSSTHSLSSGLSVTISGAIQSAYNGTFIISVVDENIFTYELTFGALTSDTGLYSSDYALLDVESDNKGIIYNSTSGAILSISSLNITAYVGHEGLTGGTDEESDTDYKVRVGESYNLTPGISTISMIIASAKKINGNTRVYVIRAKRIGGTGTFNAAGYIPRVGESVVYVLRDDDISIIPSSLVLAQTKNQLIADGHLPSWIPEDNLMVLAPILKTQNFTFTSLLPNTSTMQSAIKEQLLVFFQDNADVSENISRDDIITFINQIQDTTTGEFIRQYTLTTPSADITANSGEIYTLGTVSFV